MKLIVINSNSKGNAYILESGSEILLLESGVRLREVTSKLNPQKNVVGLCASHVHADHGKYINQYLNRFGCESVTSENAISGKTYPLGEFCVTPFEVYHDVKCFGFLVHHKEMGTLLFATDTYSLPFTFKGIDHWLIEANYADDILEDNLTSGRIDKKQHDRIIVSHFSLDNCIKALQESHAERAKNVVLLHLSARNSDKQMFRDRVAGAFGVPTYIAQKGLEVRL
jgi:ribonuclease BN (tRNA processing enzyme)